MIAESMRNNHAALGVLEAAKALQTNAGLLKAALRDRALPEQGVFKQGSFALWSFSAEWMDAARRVVSDNPGFFARYRRTIPVRLLPGVKPVEKPPGSKGQS